VVTGVPFTVRLMLIAMDCLLWGIETSTKLTFFHYLFRLPCCEVRTVLVVFYACSEK
jgi:hypothetical protein